MRNNLKGTVAVIVVGFLSFILVGSLLQFSGSNGQHTNEVASVDSRIITELDLLRAIEERRQQLTAQIGDQLPPDLLSDEYLRPLSLDNLINYHLLIDAALSGRMTVSDQSLNEMIIALPQFQRDGKYSPERLRYWLNNMRYTSTTFKKALKEDIIANQVQRSLLNSNFVTDTEWKAVAGLALQTRDFAWITLPLGSLRQQIVLSEEDIQTFYNDNKADYLSDEQIAVEYLEVTVDDIAAVIALDDDAVRRQYEQEVAAYEKEVEREAAHILIEDKEKSDERIAEVEAALAAGEAFKTLAKRYSDDFGSRESGGLLGFTTGDIFPPEFEAALAALNVGDVSKAVTTDAGTHFIKLLSIRETQAPSFEEARQRIEQTLKSAQAEDLFIEIVDALKDLSYNAENLADVAAKVSDERFTLVSHKTELFSRANAPGILATSAVNKAVFSDQVIQEGYASDVIEVAEDHAVVVKMTGHQPVRTLTLDEKRSDIESLLTLEKAKSLLAAKAEDLHMALSEGRDLALVAAEHELAVSNQIASKRDNGDVDRELLNFVFSMGRPSAGSSNIGGAHLSNGDYVLVVLSKVDNASVEALTKAESTSVRNNLTRNYSRDEFTAWQSQLRSNADIEVFAEADRSSLL